MNGKLHQVDGKFYQKAYPVLLSTNKPFEHPCFVSGIDKDKLFRWTDLRMAVDNLSWVQHHHLYILSDEEIKEDDDEGQYIMHSTTSTILRIKKFLSDGIICENINSKIEHGLGMNYKSWKKIIATTDKSLKVLTTDKNKITTGISIYENSLPRPSNDFIQAYTKAQGKGFEEVLVEVLKDADCKVSVERNCSFPNCDCNKISRLKVASDNTITIRPFKEKKQEEDPLGPLQRVWVEYLKAHPEEKLEEQLGYRPSYPDGTYGPEKCCCLGRGGIIAGVCRWVDETLYTADSCSLLSDKTLSHGTYEVLGLRSPSGSPANSDKFDALSTLNDNPGTTWSMIARILETYPEQYFTHRV